MLRRKIGKDGPEVSQVSYGTMRMLPEVDGVSATALLCELHDAGVDTHHSSYEYETHSLYLEALRKAKQSGRRFKHIVKLSVPSFDTPIFNTQQLAHHIDRELSQLGTEQIASLQWLFRTPDAAATEQRIAQFAEQKSEINSALESLKAQGKIGNVSVFPYAPEFAEAALKEVPDRTLCTYLNLWERDYNHLLDRVDAFLAIRPLQALAANDSSTPGDQSVESLVKNALRYPLLHPRVSTVIVSVNRKEHRDELIEVCAEVEPNISQFEACLLP